MTAVTDTWTVVAYLALGALALVDRYRARWLTWRTTWQAADEW